MPRGPESSGSRQAELFAAPEPELPAPVQPHPGPFATVAVDRPGPSEFTYAIPARFVPQIAPGVRVAVPFGRRREVAVVTAVSAETDVDPSKLRAIARVLDAHPLVDEHMVALARWISDRYVCSPGEALHAILPAALKRERGRAQVLEARVVPGVGPAELAELEEKFPKQHRLLRTLLEIGAPVALRDILRQLQVTESPARTLARRGWVEIRRVDARDELAFSKSDRPRPERLTDQQQVCVERISASVDAGAHRTFLLQGVTGSGKTEVYLAVIERCLALGRGAIVLVPEIALTPQTVGWFRARFDEVAVLHSGMTDVQRLDMWRRVQAGQARVVVGARSAVFAPVTDLGAIIVDEEHEPSFKQGHAPRYHAREVAVERARACGAVCVLGSATPALESWHKARAAEFEHLFLTQRVRGRPLPPVEAVDLRSEPKSGRSTIFSARLLFLLEECLARGEQAIVFQNRRGFTPVLWCSSCKETVRCSQCDVSLTFHRGIGRMVCHSCCEETARPKQCPMCTAPMLRYLGAGSERVEDELATLLPKARVQRMDSDTMRRREDYERTLGSFQRGETDVLVGTQMIAKGLDFPRVTLVGIINADGALHLPDFRAAERTFQLIHQVSGRAGRGELEGRIVVQTLTPDHPAIQKAIAGDFEGFAKEEAELREELGYPPFGRLARVVFEDREEERATQGAAACAELLRAELAADEVRILGPAPAPIGLLRGQHRRHVLVKLPLTGEGARRAAEALRRFAAQTSRPRVVVDVDPVGMM